MTVKITEQNDTWIKAVIDPGNGYAKGELSYNHVLGAGAFGVYPGQSRTRIDPKDIDDIIAMLMYFRERMVEKGLLQPL